MPLPDVTRFFHPVLAADELGSQPVRVTVAGRSYVLFRDASGAPAALDDACPHRRAPLSQGRVRPDGRLACAYHGWHFDAHGKGMSPSQPKLAGCDTRSYQVALRHGHLWLAARDVPLASLPKMEWDGFEHAGTFETLFEAPLAVCLDNFSEDEHFPYVHSFFGWGEDGFADVEHSVDVKDDHLVVHYGGAQRPSGWLPLLGVKRGDRFHNDWVTRFNPVSATFTFHWFDPKTNVERPFVSRAAIFLVPETETTTRFRTFLFLKLGNALLRASRPLVYRVAGSIAKEEIEFDAKFIPNVAHTGGSLEGMRLGKYDKAVIYARKLLDRIYFGNDGKRRLEVARGAPAWTSWRDFVVQKKTRETDDVVSLELAPADGGGLPAFAPGQHLTLRLDVPGGDREVVRCYSISNRPNPSHYRVTVKRVPCGEPGGASRFVHDALGEGHVVRVRAPSGKFCVDPDDARPIALVAGGVGITPLVCMLHAIAAAGAKRDVWLFYGARRRADFALRAEIDALAAAHPRIRVTYRASADDGARVTPELLRETLPGNDLDFYVCGPPAMIADVVEGLAAWGVPEKRVHVEAFGAAAVRSVRDGGGPLSRRAPAGVAATSALVTFLRAGKACRYEGEGTLLDLAHASGVDIQFGCRAGSCGTCATPLAAGSVDYVGVPGEEPAPGTCLPCIAVPKGSIELDA